MAPLKPNAEDTVYMDLNFFGWAVAGKDTLVVVIMHYVKRLDIVAWEISSYPKTLKRVVSNYDRL
jgi:hypothetical protein